MIFFVEQKTFVESLERLDVQEGETLHWWWNRSSLELLVTETDGAMARMAIVPAYDDILDIASLTAVGASMLVGNVDALRSALHKYDSTPRIDIGISLDTSHKGIRVKAVGLPDAQQTWVPIKSVCFDRPALIGTIKDLLQTSRAIKLLDSFYENLKGLYAWGYRGEGDTVYTLVDFRDRKLTGFYVLRKNGLKEDGSIDMNDKGILCESSRRVSKVCLPTLATQNVEGWVRLDLGLLLKGLSALSPQEPVSMTIAEGSPFGIVLENTTKDSAIKRYSFIMMSRWLPEDIEYALR